MFDPFDLRQKPNRYYQRKGQIIQTKNIENKNPAISKAEAAKYLNAVKTYFPFKSDSTELKIETKEYINVCQLHAPSFITPRFRFYPILEIYIIPHVVLIAETSKQIPDELSLAEGLKYAWLVPPDIEGTTTYYLSNKRILSISEPNPGPVQYNIWDPQQKQWLLKKEYFNDNVCLYNFYRQNEKFVKQAGDRSITIFNE